MLNRLNQYAGMDSPTRKQQQMMTTTDDSMDYEPTQAEARAIRFAGLKSAFDMPDGRASERFGGQPTYMVDSEQAPNQAEEVEPVQPSDDEGKSKIGGMLTAFGEGMSKPSKITIPKPTDTSAMTNLSNDALERQKMIRQRMLERMSGGF